ncbi:hypothetical protein [Mycobacterium sp. GA-2829]|uniref:hypothetical protein n=1 Tax=Mycobacterium sp. GA-2829 TaxID=1772283 RepID=UPI0007402779|nr:hypothetical protein [Mycobacterium sp. GA-2829]KUI36626.1 hypothetical protein AU194_22165 [Mycobacterium sp. GA-2829]
MRTQHRRISTVVAIGAAVLFTPLAVACGGSEESGDTSTSETTSSTTAVAPTPTTTAPATSPAVPAPGDTGGTEGTGAPAAPAAPGDTGVPAPPAGSPAAERGPSTQPETPTIAPGEGPAVTTTPEDTPPGMGDDEGSGD